MKKFLIIAILAFLFLPSKEAQAYEEPIAGIVVSLEAYNLNTAIKELSPIETHINYYSAIYGVDSDLIKAIIDGESNGDIQAYNINNNGTHDRGLMQINSVNFDWLEEELGITDFYDPKQNIQCGVFMIADLMDRHSEIHEILMCYNMGEKRTRELHNEGKYSSKYSRKVVKKLNKLKEDLK
jgi:soluble lytic murein transglycosylase-like protein